MNSKTVFAKARLEGHSIETSKNIVLVYRRMKSTGGVCSWKLVKDTGSLISVIKTRRSKDD